MATMIQAIRMALHVGEERLGVTDIFGEDVGPPLGGVFTGTQGLDTTWNTPLVMMTPVGAGIRGSIYHSHSFDAQATRIPGWKIVMPSTPRDAYGLLLSAIQDPNPVMFLMPKALLRVKSRPGEEIPGEPGDDKKLSQMIDSPLGDRTQWKPQWPALEELYIPIGEANVAREGRDVTVITYGRNVPMALAAADELAADGIEAEVIDLRSLHP